MPQNIQFEIPFPHTVNPKMELSRQHNMEWVHRYSLATNPESLAWYESWDMPKLSAYIYPYAQGDGLDLGCDTMAFFFVFDDQFDGPLGRNPEHVAKVCQELIECVHNPCVVTTESGSPCVQAFADIWKRSLRHANAGWRARAAHWWEYYFASYAHEAINRCEESPVTMERFLHVRRGMSATDLAISIGERVSGVDVPPVAFHSPPLRIMRRIASDVPFMCNDVYSVEKEAARGDRDNMVLVLESEMKTTRAEAVAEVVRRVNLKCRNFSDLAQELPSLYLHLNLTRDQRHSIQRYVDVMAAWIRGFQEWQTESQRYVKALDVIPSDVPGHFEVLLTVDL